MMLFGGNLSGVKPVGQQEKPKVTSLGSSDAPAAVPMLPPPIEITPHADLINRLTCQEQRLLDELERTRSKLTQEWQLKADDMRDKGLAVDLQLPLNKLARKQSRSKRGSRNQEDQLQQPKFPRHKTSSSLRRRRNESQSTGSLPTQRPSQPPLPVTVLRQSFDMLPILTTSGETPFEVGLDHGVHVLPVFRLPPVTTKLHLTGSGESAGGTEGRRASATTAITVPTEPSPTSGMTASDKEEAMRVLGLSSEEIDMIELTNSGLTTTTTAKSPTSPVASSPLPPKATIKVKRTKASMTKNLNPQHTDSMRLELHQALRNVQTYTTLVKQDIAHVQKICPVHTIRGNRFVQKWGLDKLNAVCTQWRFVSTWMKQQEARQALMHFKGTKKLDLYFRNWTKRRMAAAWTQWMSLLVAEHAAYQAALELEAANTLQRSWRAFVKRRIYTFFRSQQRQKRRHDAACTIQALCRGRFAKHTAKTLMRDIRQGRAATVIQARIRGVLTRESVVEAKRLQRQAHAARTLQAMYRGRLARRRMALLKQANQRRKAATVIQRRYRGRLHNAKQIRQMIDRERRRQAVKIQALVRGVHGRAEVVRVKERRAKHVQKQHRSAVRIQAVYRGHRSRIGTSIQLASQREALRQRTEAATTIQTLFRGRKAKHTVLAHKVARMNDMVANARVWGQFWSDDANAFFFYHSQTGEAIWEPPEDGYTKVDGQLVLRDGSVIPDPALALRVEDGTAGGDKPLDGDEETDDAKCVECDENDATRRCAQCEDVFCDACYDKTHSSGKRAQHTWKAMGPIKCVECEKMKATRWCDQCLDPYCLGCFAIIHAKGNKSLHTWKNMPKMNGSIGPLEDAQTYDEFVASNEYNYINEGIAHQDDGGGYEEGYAEYDAETAEGYYGQENHETGDHDDGGQGGGEGVSDWVAAVDDVSGELYYYNNVTGETQWAQ
ncbi:hypothetical protein DYB26_008451 [Aphanomyces astaci]|uniref:WW domain-containing protein n=1 Tax=Aphanomyces astaci TaxID=112090 RepID=A0A418CLA2_APHAT|nr:hypothetical protein DYB26_008451 [Aphanomyces astaci]